MDNSHTDGRRDAIQLVAQFGLGKPLFSAPADYKTEAAWPQPHRFTTDIAKAKQLMAEAGYANGFDTTLSFDLGFAGVNEPICVLTQESLAEAAGLDLSYVQRVERLETNPTVGVLVDFANALEVAPGALLVPAKMAPIRRGRPPKTA